MKTPSHLLHGNVSYSQTGIIHCVDNAIRLLEKIKTLTESPKPPYEVTDVKIAIGREVLINGQCFTHQIGALLKFSLIQFLDQKREWPAIWGCLFLTRSCRPDRIGKSMCDLNKQLADLIGNRRLAVHVVRKGTWNQGVNRLPQCELTVDSTIRFYGPPIEARKLLDDLTMPQDRNELLEATRKCIGTIALYPYSTKAYTWIDDYVNDNSIAKELEPEFMQKLTKGMRDFSVFLSDLEMSSKSARIAKSFRPFVKQVILPKLVAQKSLLFRVSRKLLGSKSPFKHSGNPLNIIIDQIAKNISLPDAINRFSQDTNDKFLQIKEMAIDDLEEMLGLVFGTYDVSALEKSLYGALIEAGRDCHSPDEIDGPDWMEKTAKTWAELTCQRDRVSDNRSKSYRDDLGADFHNGDS